MKSANPYRLVLVTAPDLKTARALARAGLKGRLAACVNLVPGLESHYWWHDKMESGTEVLLIFKTLARRLARLEKRILKEHPYETPEFIAIPVSGGNRDYLEWIQESCQEWVRDKMKKR